MRITVPENDVLKEMAAHYPTASSIAKLVKATGRARNDISEAVDGLIALKFVNKSDKNEVYLLVSGRKYVGIADDKPKDEAPMPTVSAQVTTNKKQLLTQAQATEPAPVAKQKPSVLLSIDALAEKLNKPTIEIADCDLKGQALAKLADLMADDIAELLLAIKSDLERVAA